MLEFHAKANEDIIFQSVSMKIKNHLKLIYCNQFIKKLVKETKKCYYVQ